MAFGLLPAKVFKLHKTPSAAVAQEVPVTSNWYNITWGTSEVAANMVGQHWYNYYFFPTSNFFVE
jgi:hypothetical protein